MTRDLAKGSASSDPDGFPLYYAGSRDGHFRVIAMDRPEPTLLWDIDADTTVPLPLRNNDWDGAALIVGDYLLEGGENGWLYVVHLNRGYDEQGLVTVDPEIVATIAGFDDELLGNLGDREVSIENSVAFRKGIVYFANSGGLVQGWDISDLLAGGTSYSQVFRFWVGDDVDASIVLGLERVPLRGGRVPAVQRAFPGDRTAHEARSEATGRSAGLEHRRARDRFRRGGWELVDAGALRSDRRVLDRGRPGAPGGSRIGRDQARALGGRPVDRLAGGRGRRVDPGPAPVESTVTVPSGAGAPHAIPVSAAIRRGPRELALALALRRESLVRLREDPRCAVTVLADGLAITVHGRAVIERELERIAVVRVDVDSIQDHSSPRFEIDAGVRWHWTSDEAAQGDAETRSALSRRDDD